MANPPLLIKRRHRLRPRHLAARCPNGAVRHQRVDLADHALHHIPPLIDLRHQPVRPMPAQCLQRRPRPAIRARPLHARILQHHRAPILRRAVRASPHHHNPAFVRSAMPGHRRVNRHHNPVQRRGHLHPQRLQPCRCPKRPLGILQHQPFQLLPPRPRARIARLHLCKERCRQIGPVGFCRRVGQHRRWVLQDRLQRGNTARRCRHHLLRVFPQPQSKLQHIPSLLGPLPLGQLVHPRAIKLRPAQRLRLMGRKHLRLGPVWPDQPFPRRLPFGAAVGGRAREYPAFPKHHHIARLINGFGHQRQPLGAARIQRPRPFNLGPHPFRPGPRFTRPAPAHDDPGFPCPLRRQLMV